MPRAGGSDKDRQNRRHARNVIASVLACYGTAGQALTIKEIEARVEHRGLHVKAAVKELNARGQLLRDRNARYARTSDGLAATEAVQAEARGDAGGGRRAPTIDWREADDDGLPCLRVRNAEGALARTFHDLVRQWLGKDVAYEVSMRTARDAQAHLDRWDATITFDEAEARGSASEAMRHAFGPPTEAAPMGSVAA